MEEELCYTTVTFKPYDNDKSTGTVRQSEEPVLYAEVKRKQSTSQTPPENKEKEAVIQISPVYRRATVFLGLLCFLLLAALTAVSAFNYIHKSKYNSILFFQTCMSFIKDDTSTDFNTKERNLQVWNNLRAQHTKEKETNLQLLAEKAVLEQERARLATQSEEMNATLDFILKKSRFLVEEYCQSTRNGVKCTPCPQKWIQNGSSCYYFHKSWPWKTWSMSQEYCQEYGAQLATIESVEEQEFINQHTTSYYDEYHGYWIGLSEKTETAWVWTTGAKLEEGFWISGPSEGYMYCVLSVTSKNPLKSWLSARCHMYNRWICEVDVLTWPTFLRAQLNPNDTST